MEMKQVKYVKELFEESIRIILNPKKHWVRVKAERDLIEGGFRKFFVPGFVLLIIACLIGDLIFESEYGFVIQNSIIKIVRKVLLLLLTMLASNMIMYELARMFKVPMEFETSRKVIVYSMMPLVLVTILISLFPFLDVVGIVSLYGFYQIYVALNVLYGITLERNLSFISLLLLCLFGSYVIIAFLLNRLTALIIY